MNQVSFRFYEELNNYLPGQMHKVWINCWAEPQISVGEKIRSFGIPLDKVDLILVNGQSKGFGYKLKDGDRISGYPVFESFDISEVSRLRENPLRNLGFICDVHLGKLCKYLRMSGWDTLYSNRYTSQEIIELSHRENRIILSRNLRLTRHKEVTHALWISSPDPAEQLKYLVDKLNLSKQANPLTRCLTCNEMIVTVEKQAILHRLEDRTATYYTEFFICPNCDQIYWKGSHFENMLKFIHSHLSDNQPI